MNPEQYEPLNPEDIGLLVGLAGPVYQESKLIDSMTGIKPTTGGGYAIDGADTIKRGLENIVQQARTSTPPNPIHQPQYHHEPPMPTAVPQEQPTYLNYVPPVVQNDPQLEFDFSLTEQKKTNELLEKQNKLLQKIVSLLESSKTDEPKPIKLNSPVKGIQNLSAKPVKD